MESNRIFKIDNGETQAVVEERNPTRAAIAFAKSLAEPPRRMLTLNVTDSKDWKTIKVHVTTELVYRASLTRGSLVIVPKCLFEAMRSRTMSRRDIVEETKISYRTLSEIESGLRTNINVETCNTLMKFFGIENDGEQK